jgi:hypothetical protein
MTTAAPVTPTSANAPAGAIAATFGDMWLRASTTSALGEMIQR